ncbi:MAG: M55 family metallopeptidase [Planctomycetota bacterium]|nr:M55 family metallopeptidase [Planctomycetota bacterium]
MKVYVSVDIEGVAGITAWEEARKEHPDYPPFRDRMAAEAARVCEAALAAGATELVVKDAHGTGRNLRADDLPAPARLIRGWSGHPSCMLQGLDASFDAVLLVGWHGPAGAGANPLAHTLSSRNLAEVQLDGVRCSEFRLHALFAAEHGVPVVLVAGDAGLCDEVQATNAAITTVCTMRGFGASTLSEHPDEVDQQLRDGVARALAGDLKTCFLVPPEQPEVVVRYKDQAMAYRKSFYPGAELAAPTQVRLQTGSMFEVMRFLMFAT